MGDHEKHPGSSAHYIPLTPGTMPGSNVDTGQKVVTVRFNSWVLTVTIKKQMLTSHWDYWPQIRVILSVRGAST